MLKLIFAIKLGTYIGRIVNHCELWLKYPNLISITNVTKCVSLVIQDVSVCDTIGEIRNGFPITSSEYLTTNLRSK
jgi:hypothetical protein